MFWDSCSRNLGHKLILEMVAGLWMLVMGSVAIMCSQENSYPQLNREQFCFHKINFLACQLCSLLSYLRSLRKKTPSPSSSVGAVGTSVRAISTTARSWTAAWCSRGSSRSCRLQTRAWWGCWAWCTAGKSPFQVALQLFSIAVAVCPFQSMQSAVHSCLLSGAVCNRCCSRSTPREEWIAERHLHTWTAGAAAEVKP